MSIGLMRRMRLDLISSSEKSIYEAMHEVEKLGVSSTLTTAIAHLQKAKDIVSDYIDYQIELTDPKDGRIKEPIV